MKPKNLGEWIDLGVSKGWCSQPVCDTHDGISWSEEELQEWEDGYDPCATVVRINLD